MLEQRVVKRPPGLPTEAEARQPPRPVLADRVVRIQQEIEDLLIRDDRQREAG
jgi:hypothetical protein